MYYLVSKENPYKMTAVIAEDNCLAVRVFTPCLLPESTTPLMSVFGSDPIKGKYFNYEGRDYVCTHEIYLRKRDSLWQGGNHLVVYTTPDLFINNLLAVARKEDIEHLQAVTVLAEVLCSNPDQSVRDADCLVANNRQGVLFTNFDYETLSSDKSFGFAVDIQAPDSVAKDEVFEINIHKRSFSGCPVTSSELIDCLSGYIPNRVATVTNGKATVRCSALLVEDFCRVQFNGIQKTIEVRQ